jgi:hypothetical protein
MADAFSIDAWSRADQAGGSQQSVPISLPEHIFCWTRNSETTGGGYLYGEASGGCELVAALCRAVPYHDGRKGLHVTLPAAILHALSLTGDWALCPLRHPEDAFTPPPLSSGKMGLLLPPLPLPFASVSTPLSDARFP